MGSLMAGWDSPVLGDDGKKVHARRNRSLTKEEVEAFWKRRRNRSSEDRGELASASASPLASPPAAASVSPFGRSEKPAAAVRVDGFLPVPASGGSGDDGDDAADSPSRSRDWWTRSSWAFLNEPPQEEPASARAQLQQRYTPQFHVARIATTGNA